MLQWHLLGGDVRRLELHSDAVIAAAVLGQMKSETLKREAAWGGTSLVRNVCLWWRAPQQKLRTHRSLKAYYATQWWRGWERWSVFFSIFLVMEHRCDRGKPKYSAEKPVPVPLCPPQILRGVTPQDRTRASAVRGRRLTAWAMARPFISELVNPINYSR
jgi:hypothetical protein